MKIIIAAIFFVSFAAFALEVNMSDTVSALDHYRCKLIGIPKRKPGSGFTSKVAFADAKTIEEAAVIAYNKLDGEEASKEYLGNVEFTCEKQ